MNYNASVFNKILFYKLPLAFLCGARVVSLTPEVCITKVRYKWINKNPFKSIYFAVLAMGAELSTGALVLTAIENKGVKNYSALVLGMQAKFHKKAVGRVYFKTVDTVALHQKVSEALDSHEGNKFSLEVVAYNDLNELIANFTFDWSIKIKV